MKKPSKFEDLTVSPEFIRELFRIEHSFEYDEIGSKVLHIQIMCEYCSEVFTTFRSGFPREDDYVNIGAKHYFKKHWNHLKPFVIEPEPEPEPPYVSPWTPHISPSTGSGPFTYRIGRSTTTASHGSY